MTFSDITRLKETEQRLQRLNDELEQRVQDRVGDLRSEVEERRIAEASLRDKEQFMRSTLDGLSAHICVLDRDGKILVTNRSWKAFAAENGGDLKRVDEGANYLDVLKPCREDEIEDIEFFRKGFQAVLSGKSRRFVREYPCDSPSEQRWFICRVDPFAVGDNRYAVVSHEIITERKLMEEALRRSERRYRVMFENSGVVKLIIDPQTGNIEDASPAACEFYGYTRDRIQSMNIMDINSLSPEEIHAEMELARTEQRDVFRFRHRLADGDIRDVDVLSSPLEIDGRILLYSVVMDVSEKKRVEQRLQMAEKTESLGRMAGAIAHNFNNMLSAVIGNLELIQDNDFHDEALDKYVNEALTASQRAATISRFMLTYLGQTKGKSERIDPVSAVTGTCSLLSATMPNNVHLKTDMPSELPCITGDSAHLTQILTNLITNSVEAIGNQEGEIVIALDTVPAISLKSQRLLPADWEAWADTYICLSVRDTGQGIAPENLNKIFDPFFTTRFAGRGLGLSVVLGLLHGFDGAVSVDNNPDHGALFMLYLPIPEDCIISSKCDMVPLPAGEAANELILVVDDEAIIRNLAKSILERKLKYQVVTACDGFEALEIFKAQRDQIRFVILDLVMPGIDGWATLAALREVQPDIRVILSSGYDEAQMSRGVHKELPQAFLPKPYGINELKAVMAAARKAPCVTGGEGR